MTRTALVAALVGVTITFTASSVLATGIDGTGGVGTCPAAGKISIKPPFTNTDQGPALEKIKWKNPKGGVCSGGSGDGANVLAMKAKGDGTNPSSSCGFLLGTSNYTVTLTAKWKVASQTPKLNPSTLTITSETGGISGQGHATFDLTGTVTAGSFAGDNVSVHVETDQDVNEVVTACGDKGIKKLTFGIAPSKDDSVEGSGAAAIGAATTTSTSTTTSTTAPTSPPMAGLAQWNKADAGVVVDGSNNVLAWNDQSGNVHNWVVGSGSVQLVAGAQNGLPIVRAAGTGNNYLTTAAYFSGTQQAEVLVVIKANRPGTDVNYSWGGFGNDGGVIGHYPWYASTIYETFGHTTRQGPIAVANGGNATRAYGIYNVSAGTGANNYVLRLNGAQLAAVTGSPAWHPTTFYLFSYWFNQNYQFLGDIGELLVYDHVLSSADRTTAYGYLKGRWATPNGL
jgi:hypothetical protein